MRERYTDMEKDLERLAGRSGGWKVPENYFENFSEQMKKQLPPYPEAPRKPDMTVWQKLKPYMGLAAMFLGIWMMMQVFHRVSQPAQVNLDNVPAPIAMIMESKDSGDLYIHSDTSIEDMELEHEISSEYKDMEEFKKAFEEAGAEHGG